MANPQHLEIIEQGVETWNKWRKAKRDIRPNLQAADLGGLDLHGINLRHSDLTQANLAGTDLEGSHLEFANLFKSNLGQANLRSARLMYALLRFATMDEVDLEGADLRFAILSRTQLAAAICRGANLAGSSVRRADLTNADLQRANLRHASLVECKIQGATFTDCEIYGVAAWNLEGEPKDQSGLIIRANRDDPEIIVDNLEVAQFIYLLRDNERIRGVIDTITSKAVLILGRFTPERKAVLDAVREKLRNLGYAPIIFDFERSAARDFTETIMTLAGMCRFIIADITNPKSSPLELQATVPDYMIPFIPIIQKGENPFSMFANLQAKYDWVLDVLVYDSAESLVQGLVKAVIVPALEKHEELVIRKAQDRKTRDIQDYL